MNGQGGEYGGPPPVTPTSGGPGASASGSKVTGPAIGLMVVAGVGIFFQVLGIVLNMLGMGMAGAFADQQEGMMRMMSGGLGMALSLIGIAIGAVIFIGAQKMKALEAYSFAMVATILAMIPCISPCCLLGIPIGIWSLIVLLNPDVKAAFRS